MISQQRRSAIRCSIIVNFRILLGLLNLKPSFRLDPVHVLFDVIYSVGSQQLVLYRSPSSVSAVQPIHDQHNLHQMTRAVKTEFNIFP